MCESGKPKMADLNVEYVNDKRQPKFWAATSLVIAACCFLRMKSVRWDVTPEGVTDVQIVDHWESVTGFVLGQKAFAREETYADGMVCKGPLKNGEPYGTWTRFENGTSTVFHMRGNRKQ